MMCIGLSKSRRLITVFTLALITLLWGKGVTADPSDEKVCIAHRGASADAPEHTLPAYKLAMEAGAHFIEQDLVMTRDGVLICLHDVALERTTNVAMLFPKRYSNLDPTESTKKTWLACDFSLEEIKTLDAGSWFDPKYRDVRIPTFQEAIDLVRTKPGTGIYPELKSPGFHHRKGYEIEQAVLDILAENGLDKPEEQAKTPIFLQCFEPEALQVIKKKKRDTYKLVQLISPKQARVLLTEVGIAQMALYADGMGPALPLLKLYPDTVKLAHENGMVVHPYTIADKYIPNLFPDALTYTHHVLYEQGVDGIFTDHPAEFPYPSN